LIQVVIFGGLPTIRARSSFHRWCFQKSGHFSGGTGAAEVGVAALADAEDVLAGDLRNRAGPQASVRLPLAIGLGWLPRLAGNGFLNGLVHHATAEYPA
jgi:hypothetical protein